MQTPQHIDATQFSESVTDYLQSRCTMQDWDLYCAACGAAIKYVFAQVSLHRVAPNEVTVHEVALDEALTEDGNCRGLHSGSVLHVAMPYCPSCEPEPQPCGCVHLPAAASTLRVQ
jgi:hypothetical protein